MKTRREGLILLRCYKRIGDDRKGRLKILRPLKLYEHMDFEWEIN